MEARARLVNFPTGPRKMRLIADVVRGIDVVNAMSILKFHPQHNAIPLAKLLKSAVSNWHQKNNSENISEFNLIVKEIYVDGGSVIKRMLPAPQGRGYKIRKRSNHVTVVIDLKK